MFQEILMKIDFISPIFYQVLYMTVVGSIVGLIIYFIRNLFDKRISGKWKCIMWSIALITLLVPIRFEIQTTKAPVIQNEIIDKVEDIKHIANYEYASLSQIEKVIEPSNIKEESTSDTIYVDNEVKTNNLNVETQNTIPVKAIFINIIIPYIWLLGTVAFILTFLSGIRKINKRITRNVYKDERLENILRECKSQLHIKKKIKIILQKYKKVPSIFGIFNPSILITEQTLEEDNETIKYIFLHELSHYKRKDILFNFVLLCVLSIHWFNPVVWFLFKKIRQDIEIGADELASRKLNQTEKKEYGMVLINLLRSRVEENYTASMLCMSDTGKNMERRILMIKGKSKSVVLSFILVTIIVGVVAGFVFVKVAQTENFDNGDLNNLSNIENKDALTEEEKIAVEEYVNKICNKRFQPITEFKDINSADKAWIYSCLTPRVSTYFYSYSTKEEIEEDLKSLFGEELVIDVEKDINSNELYYPHFDENEKNYSFPHFSWHVSAYYIIDSIEKINNQYIVNVIEFFDAADEKGEFAVISNNKGSTENSGLDDEIFKIAFTELANEEVTDKNLPSKMMSDEVLKRKDEFRSFNITIIKNDDGNFYVKEIEKNTSVPAKENITTNNVSSNTTPTNSTNTAKTGNLDLEITWRKLFLRRISCCMHK